MGDRAARPFHRRGQALVGQRGLVDAGDELAEVLQRISSNSLQGGQRLVQAVDVHPPELAPSQRDPGEQRRQVLLSAVVQVTLEPAPRGLLGFQDALAGCVDLDQLSVELVSEPGIAQSQRDLATQRVELHPRTWVDPPTAGWAAGDEAEIILTVLKPRRQHRFLVRPARPAHVNGLGARRLQPDPFPPQSF